MSHPDNDLLAMIRDELDPATRSQVERHLDGCPRCDATARDFRQLLDDLAASAPPPPAMDWTRWTAELRGRLRAHAVTGPRAPASGWWWRPVPLGLSAAMAGLLVFIAGHGVIGNGTTTDLAVVEEAIRAQRLEVLHQAPMLETLDLLEDLEIIRVLDGLAEARESGRVRMPGLQG